MTTTCLFSLKNDAETLPESDVEGDIDEDDDIEDDEYEVTKNNNSSFCTGKVVMVYTVVWSGCSVYKKENLCHKT